MYGLLGNLFALALSLASFGFAAPFWWVPVGAKQLSTVAILLYRF